MAYNSHARAAPRKVTCATLYGLLLIAALAVLFAPLSNRGLTASPKVGNMGASPRTAANRTARSVSAVPDGTVSASEILDQALYHIRRYPPLTARVRLLIRLFESELAGHGQYYQAPKDGRVCTRYELRLPVADRTAIWQQINDGDYLWWRSDIEGTATLDVVDLRRLRQWESRSGTTLPHMAGLAGLIDPLRGAIHFASVTQGRLTTEPVWIVSGEVKLPDGNPTPLNRDEFFRRNPQYPAEVTIYFGQDETLAYFPFRLEFRRDEERAGRGDRNALVMVLEFYEVRSGEPVDARWFSYSPGDQPFTDRTEEWQQRLESRKAGASTTAEIK